MKKLFTFITLVGLFTGAVFAADQAASSSSWFNSADLSVKGSVAFESEYLYRGRALAFDTIVTSVEGAYKLYNGSLYAGVLNHDSATSSQPTAISLSTALSESDFYVGYKLPVYEKFSADFGYTYYWYQQNGVTPDRRNEIYAGVVYNGLWINPAAYIYYDFNMQAITGELSGKYSLDLAKYGCAKTALDLGGYFGAISANDVLAGQGPGGFKSSSGYIYYGATADLVYSFTKNAAASVGIRYAGNNGGDVFSVIYPERNSFFWGAKFTAGF